MPRKAEPLTDVKIRKTKPTDTARKLFDGGGLYLNVQPNGARYWRMKYPYGGKERLLALGVYPEVSLAEARGRRDTARALLRDGKDPGAERVASKETERRQDDAAFPSVAAAWLAFKRKEWADETYRKAVYVTDKYLVPQLKSRTITSLSTKHAADVLAAIAETAPSLASKARQYLGGIVQYAIRHGLRDDGRLLSLRGAVPKHTKGHIPAATDLPTIARLVRAIEGYPTPVTRWALKLAMLTAARPGEIVTARWSEIDLDAAEWHRAGEDMKMGRAHIVSLPRQALALLGEMHAYSAGREFVFPPLARQKTRHLHRDALSNALRKMGFQGLHATHGFRAMLRTVARERMNVDMDVLEAQLGHAKKGDVQKAYDRTTFNEPRRKVMQEWADFLDALRDDTGKVTPIHKRKTV